MVSNTLYNRTSWTTQHALSSDHLPIISQLTYDMTTDYKKNGRPLPTTRKQTGHNLQKTLLADKHNIIKGKMHISCRLLPEDIVCKSTQRNNIRRPNTRDPALELLNEEITSYIQKHKQNIWKELIGITGTTHTHFGRPYMVYPTEHHHPH